MDKAKGKYLDAIAAMLGLKRCFFGLEPDFMLRRRVAKVKGISFL